MRSRFIVLSLLLAVSSLATAHAAAPNPVVAVLGPSVGYMISQSDLCQWGIADRIRKTFQDAFKAVGMTEAQQATAWDKVAATQKAMAQIPDDAKARMKLDTCSAESRARVEQDLSN